MEKRGDAFNLRIFWEDLLFTTNPEHIKLILATDFHNYEKGEFLCDEPFRCRVTPIRVDRCPLPQSDGLGVGVWRFQL